MAAPSKQIACLPRPELSRCLARRGHEKLMAERLACPVCGGAASGPSLTRREHPRMLERARVMRRSTIHRAAHRLLAVAALLSLVVGSAATGGTWLRCRTTGVLLPDCCCPGDAADESKPSPATTEADDCCDRVVTSVDQTPSELASRDASVAPALVAFSTDAFVTAAHAVKATPSAGEQPRAGPPTTRAFLLFKGTLLI
jgi:hypothetical protein